MFGYLRRTDLQGVVEKRPLVKKDASHKDKGTFFLGHPMFIKYFQLLNHNKLLRIGKKQTIGL